MDLAVNISDECIKDINNRTQSIINQLIFFDKYKDCRDFVKFVNREKFFTMLLLLREYLFIKGIAEIENAEDSFLKILFYSEKKVEEIKNYPNKNLKKKYLRIDNNELELFDYLKIRDDQIRNNTYPKLLSDYEMFLSDESIKKTQADIEDLPYNERAALSLGKIYMTYRTLDADILNPITKKLIKDAHKILKNYAIKTTDNDFEQQLFFSSFAYKKALEELAK